MVFDTQFLSQELTPVGWEGKSIIIGDQTYKFTIETVQKHLDRIQAKLNIDIVSNDYVSYLYNRLTNKFTLDEFNDEMSTSANDFYTTHCDYMKITSYITVNKIHRSTKADIVETTRNLYYSIDPNNKDKSKIHYIHQVSKDYLDFVEKHGDELNAMIDYQRDYDISYFGLETLKKSYLKSEIPLLDENGNEKQGKKQIECPQHTWMRVAVGIHKHWNDLKSIKETYDYISQKYFTHATPTLFNSGSDTAQLASCFLIKLKFDSLDGILDTMRHASLISKHGGGVSIYLGNIRAKNSRIKSTQGKANGLRIARVLDALADFFNQGGRSGSFVIYIEPWHSDIEMFLNFRKNGGNEKDRARDLFLGLTINDLFMETVEKNEDWYLMCPDECPGLCDTYGEEFNALYKKYVSEGRYRKVMKAQKIWFLLLERQIEQGLPYMMYKDAMNMKSNQKNLGTIVCSNLCTEIIEYTSPDEIAVCNLASICLPKCIVNGVFDFTILAKITKIATRNLNRIIDINYYTSKETKYSNFKNRPIGLGVQGLADVFIMLRMAFDSPEASQLNKDIFETMYFNAMETSIDLAIEDGPYESFPGSPLSEGKFQFDLWASHSRGPAFIKHSGMWDWETQRERVKKHGARNSLLIAPMPTASTSQIMGNNECFEPYTTNIYSRSTSAGKFKIVNEHLVRDLIKLGLWNKGMRDEIMKHDGSVQNIESIPKEIRVIYKTSWDLSQKVIVRMAADRGIYVDQSQSMNIHIADPDYEKLTTIHYLGWELGLKTGMYYLRSKPKANAKKFHMTKVVTTDKMIDKTESFICTDDVCIRCSS